VEPSSTPELDPLTREAIRSLADIVSPPPVSWMPQTWGWAALALLVVLLAIWGAWRWHQHRQANRYRRDALAELADLEQRLDAPQSRAEALAAIPVLLKRTALAAWPREVVSPLSGSAWVAFLRANAGGATFPDKAAALLDDAEYRGAQALEAFGKDEARAVGAAARQWIEGHRVSA
jgi:Domain of unknown function (DUF4381)